MGVHIPRLNQIINCETQHTQQAGRHGVDLLIWLPRRKEEFQGYVTGKAGSSKKKLLADSVLCLTSWAACRPGPSNTRCLVTA